MSTTVRPFLMFEGNAEEAMEFYVSLFADGQIVDIVRYGAQGPAREGTVQKASFTIAGQTILCTDSFVHHAFSFTPAFSLFVDCPSEDEIQRLANALGEQGTTLMPLADYGFSRQFVWLNDRFGVSWQLNLP